MLQSMGVTESCTRLRDELNTPMYIVNRPLTREKAI